MKVLHFVDCNTLSWLEPWLAHMDALSHLGVDQELLCRPGGDIARRARERGMTVYEWRPNIAAVPFLSPSYRSVVKRAAPSIIHTRLSSASGISGYWSRSLDIPTIATFDKPAKAKYYTKIDRFISCAKWLKDYMVEHEGLSADRIDVVYNSVDTNRYVRDAEARARIRRELSIRDNELLFAGMGIYIERKGFDVLIRAFAEAISLCSEKDLKLVLIGGEADEPGMCERYTTIARECGVADRLIMPREFVQDVRPWLWAADFFVMPSREEGFSIALIEALASGLPAIVSDIAPCKELISDGENGLVAIKDDVPSFAAAMARLAAMDKGKIDLMVASSYRFLDDNCTLEAGAKKTFELYSKILECRK